jgi:broad-specificity NMP kinase
MRIIVTGVPGCGKTTLATQLAAELGVRYLGKDQIKEALWDAIGPGDITWSHELGAAASVALLHLTGALDDAVVDHPVPSAHSEEWRALADVVEVHVRCAPEVGRERYASRNRHPCHFDQDRITDYDVWLDDDAKRAPLGPRLDVDSSDEVDVTPIVEWVRSL